jgi:hypothetical protein
MSELLDDSLSLLGLARHLRPGGLHCPRCGSTARRLSRDPGHFAASSGRACEGYDTLRAGTIFEIRTPLIRRGGAPISGKGTGPRPMLGPPASV